MVCSGGFCSVGVTVCEVSLGLTSRQPHLRSVFMRDDCFLTEHHGVPLRCLHQTGVVVTRIMQKTTLWVV